MRAGKETVVWSKSHALIVSSRKNPAGLVDPNILRQKPGYHLFLKSKWTDTESKDEAIKLGKLIGHSESEWQPEIRILVSVFPVVPPELIRRHRDFNGDANTWYGL